MALPHWTPQLCHQADPQGLVQLPPKKPSLPLACELPLQQPRVLSQVVLEQSHTVPASPGGPEVPWPAVGLPLGQGSGMLVQNRTMLFQRGLARAGQVIKVFLLCDSGCSSLLPLLSCMQSQWRGLQM